MATLYDIFTGLAVDAPVAGTSWDSGSLTWSASAVTTPMVGKGSGEVGGPASPSSFSLGNVTAPVEATGYAVFFKPITGRDTTNTAITMYLEGSGAASEYPASNTIRAVLGGYGEFSLTEFVGGVAGTPVSDALGLTTNNEYCLEVLRTDADTYVASAYNASAGVRVGSALKTITLNAANPTTDARRLLQLQCPIANQPYIRLNRVEIITADGGTNVTGTATWTEAADTASLTGTVTVPMASITTPALKNNTGTLLASQTGVTVYVYSVTDGSLVVTKTGQTTNVSGVMVISDAALTAATEYRLVIVLGSGAEGMDRLTAA